MPASGHSTAAHSYLRIPRLDLPRLVLPLSAGGGPGTEVWGNYVLDRQLCPRFQAMSRIWMSSQLMRGAPAVTQEAAAVQQL